MSQACSISTRQPYGVTRVLECWHVPRSSFYRQRCRAQQGRAPTRKRGPKTVLSDAELVERIRAVLEASPFVGEGYRKAWAKLRHEGVRASKERVRRLMREHGLLAPVRARRTLGPRVHDGRITTDRPDQMWGTDLTTTMTVEDGQVAVFIAVDHCTSECVGIHAATRATRFEALEPIRQGVRRCFGAFAAGIADGLAVRHDHGSQYVSEHFQSELAFLGIESSPAFVRAPEGNGVAERFIKTLKEQVLWVRAFRTVEELRLALHAWVARYNERWLVARHGYRSPADVRRQLLEARAAA